MQPPGPVKATVNSLSGNCPYDDQSGSFSSEYTLIPMRKGERGETIYDLTCRAITNSVLTALVSIIILNQNDQESHVILLSSRHKKRDEDRLKDYKWDEKIRNRIRIVLQSKGSSSASSLFFNVFPIKRIPECTVFDLSNHFINEDLVEKLPKKLDEETKICSVELKLGERVTQDNVNVIYEKVVSQANFRGKVHITIPEPLKGKIKVPLMADMRRYFSAVEKEDLREMNDVIKEGLYQFQRRRKRLPKSVMDVGSGDGRDTIPLTLLCEYVIAIDAELEAKQQLMKNLLIMEGKREAVLLLMREVLDVSDERQNLFDELVKNIDGLIMKNHAIVEGEREELRQHVRNRLGVIEEHLYLLDELGMYKDDLSKELAEASEILKGIFEIDRRRLSTIKKLAQDFVTINNEQKVTVEEFNRKMSSHLTLQKDNEKRIKTFGIKTEQLTLVDSCVSDIGFRFDQLRSIVDGIVKNGTTLDVTTIRGCMERISAFDAEHKMIMTELWRTINKLKSDLPTAKDLHNKVPKWAENLLVYTEPFIEYRGKQVEFLTSCWTIPYREKGEKEGQLTPFLEHMFSLIEVGGFFVGHFFTEPEENPDDKMTYHTFNEVESLFDRRFKIHYSDEKSMKSMRMYGGETPPGKNLISIVAEKISES